MGDPTNQRAPDADLSERLHRAGQEHVLRWWDELSDRSRTNLVQQLAHIDLEQMGRLAAEHLRNCGPKQPIGHAEPAPVLRCTDTSSRTEAVQAGQQALRAGQVGVVLVAGGQGTRLGFDKPKGMFPIGPISGNSLFQVFAEKVLGASRRYGAPMPYYIMTSPATDASTRELFERHRFFGLDPTQVHCFQQGTMPAVDPSGRLLLEEKARLSESPNGHGGLLQALRDHRLLDPMRDQGVRWLFYHQVDNPLVKVCDPEYIGRHILTGSEFSLKVIAKDGPHDRLGNPCRRSGHYEMIEYSDLPDELATAKDLDGGLRFWAGSIAIHVISTELFQRLAASGQTLPYHRASKRIPHIDASGQRVEPEEPNGTKFERFIFDAMPFAKHCLVMETPRDEEYHPLKDAAGTYSAEHVRRARSRVFASWLEQAGKSVPRHADGLPAVQIEISPLFALDAQELIDKADRIPEIQGDLHLTPEGE